MPGDTDFRRGVMPGPAAADGVPPAERARTDAGYGGPDGLARFARRMRVSPRYARHVEIHGGAPEVYMMRALALLGCDPSAFDRRTWPRDPRARPRKKA
jgi:hypothetical protein